MCGFVVSRGVNGPELLIQWFVSKQGQVGFRVWGWGAGAEKFPPGHLLKQYSQGVYMAILGILSPRQILLKKIITNLQDLLFDKQGDGSSVRVP